MTPLLMVHGIGSCARETFGAPGRVFEKLHPGSMCAFLQSLGYQPGKNLFWYSYWTLSPLPVLARRLQTEIERARQKTGGAQIDLLTFSLGGIISKYYTISPWYQDDLRRLVMIAPPFFGSRWADWFRSAFAGSEKDVLFPGDGKALSPQLLKFQNPFLQTLAAIPFPPEIETTVIAMRSLPGSGAGPLAFGRRWLSGWAGAGDGIVPVASAKVPVDHFLEVTEQFSKKTIHKYLPRHPRIQELVGQQLFL